MPVAGAAEEIALLRRLVVIATRDGAALVRGEHRPPHLALDSSDGLKYDETCTYFYKEGTITYKARTGTMTMTYGCNTATVVKVDGTTI